MILSFCEMNRNGQQEITPSANALSIPIALHSNQSARALLHTTPVSCLINTQGRPGKCSKCEGLQIK